MEFRDFDERRRRRRRLSLTLPTFLLVILGLLLLGAIILSGTPGQVDVSIPTRLFPGG